MSHYDLRSEPSSGVPPMHAAICQKPGRDRQKRAAPPRDGTTSLVHAGVVKASWKAHPATGAWQCSPLVWGLWLGSEGAPQKMLDLVACRSGIAHGQGNTAAEAPFWKWHSLPSAVHTRSSLQRPLSRAHASQAAQPQVACQNAGPARARMQAQPEVAGTKGLGAKGLGAAALAHPNPGKGSPAPTLRLL